MSRAQPDLTVCSLVNASPARLAVGLSSLGWKEAEVVLAVDDRVDPAWLDGYRELADQVLVIPYQGGLNPMYAWLVDQCSGRWIFYLEADEVASPALGEELREVIRRDDVTHCFSPRRWLFPEPRSWLAQWPWRPDYQLRLIRNEPAVLRFPAQLHWYVSAVGARRWLREPIYHLSLLLLDVESRRRKCRQFDDQRPGMTIDGGPFNEAFYLPERHDRLKTEAVPSDALAAVEAFLAADSRDVIPLRHPAGRIAYHAAEEITFKRERSLLDDDAYQARLVLLDDDLRMVAGEVRTFDVEISNLGSAYWPGTFESHPQIHIGCRWVTSEGSLLEGLRTPLGAPLGPGESAVIPVAASGPEEPGLHEIEIDLVHELVRWFGCGVRARVRVRESGLH